MMLARFIAVNAVLAPVVERQLGVLTWLQFVVILFVGLLLIIADLVLFPGTFVIGSLGVLVMLGGAMWAIVSLIPGAGLVPATEAILAPVLKLTGALLCSALGVVLLAKYLPRTSLYGRFALGASNPRGPSFSDKTVSSPEKLHVGEEGVAHSVLRPSGNAVFGALVVDVVTRGEYAEAGTPIRVLAIEGSRIVVEAA